MVILDRNYIAFSSFWNHEFTKGEKNLNRLEILNFGMPFGKLLVAFGSIFIFVPKLQKSKNILVDILCKT